MVKVKSIKKKIDDGSELNEIFNQLLNIGDNVNVNICYPKYLNIENIVKKYLQLLKFLMKNSIDIYYPKFSQAKDDLSEYITNKEGKMAELFKIKFPREIFDYSILPEEQVKEFAKVYKQMKEDNILKDLFRICENLTSHKNHIDVEEVRIGYFHDMISEFTFLPFLSLDFRDMVLYLDSVQKDFGDRGHSEEAQRVACVLEIILLFIKKIYLLSKELVDEYTAPDVNIDELIEHIINSIDKIKKYVPRCGKAFSRLRKATDLLKDNFTTYYADFLETKKQNIILQNFIGDVMKTIDDDNLELVREFKEILKFINTNENAVKNPQCAKFADMANDLLDSILQSEGVMETKREEKDEQIKKMKEQFGGKKTGGK